MTQLARFNKYKVKKLRLGEILWITDDILRPEQKFTHP